MKSIRDRIRVITTAISKARKIDKNEDGVKPFKSMPGPKPLPIIKNLWRYFPIIGTYDLKRIHHTYAKMFEEYGPIIREHVYGKRILVHVYDPVDMETVYRNGGKYPIRRSHTVLQRYRNERKDKYSCAGLFPSNGEEWFKFRHMFQQILMSANAGQVCASDIEDITEDLMKCILARLDENSEVDIQPLLFRWALECVGAVGLNRRLGCLSDNGNKEVMELIEAVHKTHLAVFHTENSPLRKRYYYKILEKSQDHLSSVVEKYLKEAVEEINQGKHKDSILAQMITAENITSKDAFTMMLDMFLAGIDTTSYTVAFAFYNLSKTPRVQEKLREQLMEVLPEKTTRVSSFRCRMPYVQRVMRETFRLNPVAVGTGRVLPCDLVLGGYKVPAGTMVILQHQVSSMQEKYFPDPKAFIPERWDLPMPMVSSPFGSGPRMCIGFRIARTEMKLAIARVMRNFKLSYHHEDIDTFTQLINIPDKPVLLRFKPLPR